MKTDRTDAVDPPISRFNIGKSFSNTIYILANPRILGEYKLGIHQGGLQKLQNRYRTYIPDVKIHYMIENIHARKIEKQFKNVHADSRIPFELKRGGENLSEWYEMPLDQIITDLLLMIIGRNRGFDGKDTFRVTKLEEQTLDGTKIIRPQVITVNASADDKDAETEEDD